MFKANISKHSKIKKQTLSGQETETLRGQEEGPESMSS